MLLRDLTELQRALLEILPVAPGGESLDALAEELLGRRGPVERGRIRRGLDGVSAALDGIHIGRGTDALDRAGALLYALRRRDMRRVRAFFRRSVAEKGAETRL